MKKAGKNVEKQNNIKDISHYISTHDQKVSSLLKYNGDSTLKSTIKLYVFHDPEHANLAARRPFKLMYSGAASPTFLAFIFALACSIIPPRVFRM